MVVSLPEVMALRLSAKWGRDLLAVDLVQVSTWHAPVEVHRHMNTLNGVGWMRRVWWIWIAKVGEEVKGARGRQVKTADRGLHDVRFCFAFVGNDSSSGSYGERPRLRLRAAPSPPCEDLGTCSSSGHRGQGRDPERKPRRPPPAHPKEGNQYR